MEDFKICSKCSVPKPINSYAKKRGNKDGVQLICKECDKKRNKQWRLSNPDKEIAKSKKNNLRNKAVLIQTNIVDVSKSQIIELSKSILNNTQMKKELIIKRQLVTPMIAKDILAQNIKNRKIDQRVVNRYASDMANNRWIVGTGELIKISDDNVLIDGQHRLLAVIKSEMPIFLDFNYNQDFEIFKVIDSGKKRGTVDTFSLKGINSASSLPSMIVRNFALKMEINGKSLGGAYDKLTNQKISEIYDARPEFWDLVAKNSNCWYAKFAKMLAPQIIGGMYSYFLDISKSDANDFMEQLCTGKDITNNTILSLRTKIMEDRISLKKLPKYILAALIVKSWNMFRKKQEIKVLKFSPDIEDFPIAI